MFSNWKFISYFLGLKGKKRQAVNLQLFFVSMFNVWKLGRIKIYGCLHCIDIYDHNCIFTLYIFMVLLWKTHTQNNILFTIVRARIIRETTFSLHSYSYIYSTTKHEILQISNHNLLCSLDPPNQGCLFWVVGLK